MNDRDRGQTVLLGAILLFGFLITALVVYQAQVVPAQNSEIEADHYLAVQDDLQETRAALVSAGEAGEKRSTTVTLGTTYPTRVFTINAPSPAGTLRTESVGDGAYESDEIDLGATCGYESTEVPTQSLVYSPNYRYFDGGDVDHRLESTLLYQEDGNVTRTGQTIVDPEENVVSLYPVRGELDASGVGAETIDFHGNATGGAEANDVTITVPTTLAADHWADAIDDGEVTVTQNSPETVDLELSGEWTVLCHPVGVNQGSGQTQAPSPPPDEEDEEEESETEEINPSGEDRLVYLNAEGNNDGTADLTFNNTGETTKMIEKVRVPFYYGDEPGSDPATEIVSLDDTPFEDGPVEIGEPLANLDSGVEIAHEPDEVTIPIEFDDGLDTRSDFFILVVELESGDRNTYFIAPQR